MEVIPTRRSDKRSATCQKCGRTHNESLLAGGKGLSRHHVYPKRYSWPGHLRGKRIWLCRRPCHDRLEAKIGRFEEAWGGQLPHDFYYRLAEEFCMAS